MGCRSPGGGEKFSCVLAKLMHLRRLNLDSSSQDSRDSSHAAAAPDCCCLIQEQEEEEEEGGSPLLAFGLMDRDLGGTTALVWSG